MDTHPAALRAFVVAARQQTYAGHATNGQGPLPGARLLEHRQQAWHYRDSYVGGEHFAGQEVVYNGEAPVWTMVYTGGYWPGSEPDAATVLAFLQAALLAEVGRCRLPGRATYSDDRLLYTSISAGDLDWFEGSEEIRCNGPVVYRLTYAGGRLR